MTFAIDRARFDDAPRFPAWIATAVKHADLWSGLYRTASVPAEAIEAARQDGAGFRLLALSEDWCGDAVSTLPVAARLAEGAGLDLRVLNRDANPDIMDAHLTSGTRSIPVVMILDAGGRERGWWGPRPAPLQRWMRDEALLLPKEERTRRKRAWYARDRGRTTVAEILDALRRARRRERRLAPSG